MRYQGIVALIAGAICILALGSAATGVESMNLDPGEALNLPDFIVNLVEEDTTEDSNSQQGESGEEKSEGSVGEGEDGNYNFDQAYGEAQERIEAGMETINERAGGGGDGGVGQDSGILKYVLFVVSAILVLIILTASAILVRRHKDKIIPSKDPSLEDIYNIDIDESNSVYVAWSQIIKNVDSENIITKTPEDIAEMAIEDEKMNPESVRTITDLFEKALYSPNEITSKQEREAEHAMEELFPEEDQNSNDNENISSKAKNVISQIS